MFGINMYWCAKDINVSTFVGREEFFCLLRISTFDLTVGASRPLWRN